MATIATHNGSKVRQAHNLRVRSCVEKEPHIDLTRVHDTWIHESVSDAYHRLFDAARAEYNARQTRADRKLTGTYLAEVQKDEKKHPCYEMIIGVYGDEVSDDVSKEIMRQFVAGWKERNPNLELIGAYYHADEEGKNPHVHLDYIPVAHGYQRGPETQTGLVRAFEEQGIVKHGRATAQIQWEARENDVLEALCRERGLMIEHPQEVGEKVKHAETRVYKAEQKAKTAERKSEQAALKLEMQEGRLTNLKESIREAKAQKLDALRERDAVRVDVDVRKAVYQAVEPFRDGAVVSVPEILAEKKAKPRSLFSREKPAMVTIRRDAYDHIVEQLGRLELTVTQAEESADRMEHLRDQIQEAAEILRRNKIDSYEVAVDTRVQASDRTTKLAQESERKAVKSEAAAMHDKAEAEAQLRLVREELRQMQLVTSYYPDEWKQMQERTAVAREIEEMYDHARVGVPDARVSDFMGQTVFQLPDGTKTGYLGLLTAYKETCNENGIPHDEGMFDHLDELIERQRDLEPER